MSSRKCAPRGKGTRMNGWIQTYARGKAPRTHINTPARMLMKYFESEEGMAFMAEPKGVKTQDDVIDIAGERN